jgi:predicted extracellular nuclease
LQVDLLIGNEPLTVFVNHFKSKRGGEFETEPRRIAQAEHINSLVAGLLQTDPGAAIIVTGDFNDYGDSVPMQTLTEGDGVLTNVLWQIPEERRYSFVFSGASQLIDGMLISPGLLESVAAVDILHTNADYPDAWSSDLSPERIAYKSTDHDIPLLVLQLGSETSVSEPTATPVATPKPDVQDGSSDVSDSAETDSAVTDYTPFIAAAILVGVSGLGGFLFWRNRRNS